MTKFAPEVEPAIESLADDKSAVDYVISVLNDDNIMGLAESGTGGRNAVYKFLEENCESSVATGAFLVIAVDDRGNTKSIRRKYVHFIWVGPKTPLMKKAKVASQSGSFKEMFNLTKTLSIQISDTDELAEETLEKKLRACGGAHQPTSFDFTNSIIYEEEE